MEQARRRRLDALAHLAPLTTAIVVATSGCGGEPDPPQTLADGSRARSPRVALEGVDGPVVLSKALVRDARTVEKGSRIASCLDSGWSESVSGLAVHTIGVFGESVTFGDLADRSLRACDDTPASDRAGPAWCGHSFGRLTRGRLRDPRLDLGCEIAEGGPVAFAWVEPRPGTEYVVVHQAGFGEAYEPAAGLAVRVATTTGIDATRSRVVFDVSEHSADGRRLRTYELEATVSG